MGALIGTSWKMNLTPSEAADWFRAAVPRLTDVVDRELFVLPPFPSLVAARDALTGTNVGWGAQDVHPSDGGPHTGDVSAPMLADLGCRYVEIGHSERRRDHGESNGLIAAKVAAALRWGLTPIVCVGERRPAPIATVRRILSRQLSGGLGGLRSEELATVVVAYEPVWAIGVGAAAAPEAHIATAHAAIRAWLAGRGAKVPRVIYGGSVDARNAASILALPCVDGLFVGRAALDPAVFARIAGLPISHPEG
jgi:triosephosphate isomerase